MTLGLPVTLGILAAAFALFGFALWRGRQPADPMRVRMVNYHLVQLFAILIVLLMAAHLLTLFKGTPTAAGVP